MLTAQCKFGVERPGKQGSQIPKAIEEALTSDLFVPEDFEELVLEFANNNEAVGKLLRESQEPRPAGQDCIRWLGETAMKERLLRLCARGKIALNVRGMEYLQTYPGEVEDTAWRWLRPKLSLTGRHLDDVFVMQPSAVPATGGSTVSAVPPPTVGGIFGGNGTTPPVPPVPGGDTTTSAPLRSHRAASSVATPRAPRLALRCPIQPHRLLT